MDLLLALLVLVLSIALLGGCLLGGVWSLFAGRSHSASRGAAATRGLILLLGAIGTLFALRLAVPIAESKTGWVDTDNDGMLDGFSNGAYDWVDLNLGAWASAAGVMLSIVIGGLAILLAATARSRATFRGDTIETRG